MNTFISFSRGLLSVTAFLLAATAPVHNWVLFIIIGLGISIAANCQQYQFSTPLSGSIGLIYQDRDRGNANVISYNSTVSSSLAFNTLTETVYIDTIAQTIRQVGFASVVQDNPVVINETRLVSGQPVLAKITLNSQLPGSGLFFDTGLNHYSYYPNYWLNGGNPTYVIDGGPRYISLIPVNVSYSLETGGQTYNGAWSYSIGGLYSSSPGLMPYSYFTLGSEGLTIAGFNRSGSLTGGPYYTAGYVAPLTLSAANGFSISVSAGPFDFLDSATWSAGSITIPEPAPEPSSLALLGCGLFGLVFARKLKGDDL